MVVGDPETDLTLLPRPHAGDGLIDLGHDGAVADHELIAGLPDRLLALHRQHVVHDGEVAGSRRALDVAELGLLLTHPIERGVHLGAAHRHRGVLDLDALHVTERDVGLDLDDSGEGQRSALLEPYVLEIGLADGIEPHLGERLSIDVGNEVLRDLSAHVVGEVDLHQRARDVTFAEAGQSRLLLHAIVRALPFLRDDIGRRLDDETPLAALHLLDRDLHRSLKWWCERGESNPQGRSAHWILSPARLPVSPLSHRCGFHAQQNTQEEPDAARRPPFCRFTTLSSLADRAEQSGPPRSSTDANPATGTHLEAL